MIDGIGTAGIGALATRVSLPALGKAEQSDFLALAARTTDVETPKATTKTTDDARTTADSSAKLKDALAAFRKEAAMTPAERARRDVLESMELTEEAIEAMTPEQRAATEEKIAMEVARRMQAARTAA